MTGVEKKSTGKKTTTTHWTKKRTCAQRQPRSTMTLDGYLVMAMPTNHISLKYEQKRKKNDVNRCSNYIFVSNGVLRQRVDVDQEQITAAVPKRFSSNLCYAVFSIVHVGKFFAL